MAGAIHSLITADHSDFRASLAAMESDTGRAMGRVGAIVKTNTRGWRDMTGAILGTVAVTGLIAGAAAGAAKGVLYLLDTQQRVTEEVRKERAERDRILIAARATTRALEARLGLREQTPNYDAVRGQIDQLRAQRADAAAKALSLGATERSFSRMGLAAEAEYFSGIGEKARDAVISVRDMDTEIERLIALLRLAKDLDAEIVAAQRMARIRETRGIDEGNRIAMLELEGRQTEALREAERQRFRDELEAITRLEEAGKSKLEGERARAEERHRHEMDRIGREAGERARLSRLGADLSGKSMQAEEARLVGQTEVARIIEEEIRLTRELEAIRQTSGLSRAERARREEQARRISALRLDHREDPSRGAEIASGVQRSAMLLRQVFPGNDTAARQAATAQQTADSTRQTAAGVTSIVSLVTQILTGGLRVPLVLRR